MSKTNSAHLHCFYAVKALILLGAALSTGLLAACSSGGGGGGSAAPAGSVDTGFGTGGTVVTNVSTNPDVFRGVTVQSDDKIIAVGYSTPTTSQDFLVVRYNSDGSLDTSFGTGGIVWVDFGLTAADTDDAYDVVVQTDGKIIVVGTAMNDFAVCRLNSNGTLDTTFDTDGKRTFDFGGANADIATAVALRSDGSIIITGISAISTNDFGAVCLNANGSTNTTWGTNGFQSLDFGGGDNDRSWDVVVLGDNSVILGGECKPGNLGVSFGVCKFTPTGAIDTTFGVGTGSGAHYGSGNGYAWVDFDGQDDMAYAMGLSGSNVVLAGEADDSGSKMGVARFSTAGVLDQTFGTLGRQSISFGATYQQQVAEGIIIQPNDGKIVIAGYVDDNITLNQDDFAVARLNTDATLDLTFDTDGLVTTSINGLNSDAAHDCALQLNRIVAVGETEDTTGDPDVAMIRYNR